MEPSRPVPSGGITYHFKWNKGMPLKSVFSQRKRSYSCPMCAREDAEVNISPKISISALPLKMALHKNPAMHGSQIAIFLHGYKTNVSFAQLKALFWHDLKVNSLKPARYHIIHCIVFYFVFLGTALQIVAAHD